MEVSYRLGSVCRGRQLGLRRRSELAFDRLCAVASRVGPWWLGRRRGFEEAGGGALYPAGFRSRGFRAIVIFALIHRPILPLSFVALFAQ